MKLFRLAWDIGVSAFGGRQVLYERFFFGDPVRMAGALYQSYDKRPYMEKVDRFLDGPACGPRIGRKWDDGRFCPGEIMTRRESPCRKRSM